MKLRLEVGKTTIRLNKDELQKLISSSQLSQDSVFPDGNKFSLQVKLGKEQNISFTQSKLAILLPAQNVINHKPDKSGLSFDFGESGNNHHQVLFEVDIKKTPLGSRKSSNVSKAKK